MFDRCVEAEVFFIPLALFVVAFVVFHTWKFSHKKIHIWWQVTGLYFFSIFIICPLLLVGGYFIGIFNCTAGAFWKGVNPAFTIYIKKLRRKGFAQKLKKNSQTLIQLLIK